MMQGFERNRIFWHLICTHLEFLFIICLKIPPLMYLLSLKVKTRFFNKIFIPVYSIIYVWICFIFLSFCLVPIYREKKNPEKYSDIWFESKNFRFLSTQSLGILSYYNNILSICITQRVSFWDQYIPLSITTDKAVTFYDLTT